MLTAFLLLTVLCPMLSVLYATHLLTSLSVLLVGYTRQKCPLVEWFSHQTQALPGAGWSFNLKDVPAWGGYHNGAYGDTGRRVKVNNDIPKTQNFFTVIKTYFFCHPHPIYFKMYRVRGCDHHGKSSLKQWNIALDSVNKNKIFQKNSFLVQWPLDG